MPPPAHTTTKEVDKPPKPSHWPNPGPTPTFTADKELESKGNCCLFSLPPAAAGAPKKALTEFLVCFLSISTDYGRPRTQVSNISIQFINTKPLLFSWGWKNLVRHSSPSSLPLPILPSGLHPICPCSFLPDICLSFWPIMSVGPHILSLCFSKSAANCKRKIVPNLVWDRTFFFFFLF